MTFAEITVFILLISGVYFLLRPVRERLERFFYSLFRGKSRPHGTIIDITGSFKKKDSPNE